MSEKKRQDRTGETIPCDHCGGVMGVTTDLDGQRWICACRHEIAINGDVDHDDYSDWCGKE